MILVQFFIRVGFLNPVTGVALVIVLVKLNCCVLEKGQFVNIHTASFSACGIFSYTLLSFSCKTFSGLTGAILCFL